MISHPSHNGAPHHPAGYHPAFHNTAVHHPVAHHAAVHNPILEVIHEKHRLAEHIDKRISQVGLAGTAVHAVAGARAFREYSWLTDTVGLNKSGNLRGMVLSAKWRTAFTYIGKVGEHLENVGRLAGFAASIAEAAPEVDRVLESGDSNTMKGMHLARIAGTAAQRALLGAVPAGVHLIYRSLEGWCLMAGLAGGKAQSAANECVGVLHRADSLVQSSFKTVTDTRNQADAIWWVIDTTLSLRPATSSPK